MLSVRLDGESILLPDRRWADQEAFLRKAAREGRLQAPCCGAPLVLKWGERKVRHCAHPPRVSCPYDRWSEPESAEHMAGKLRLYEWCRAHFAGRITVLAVEHPLPETLQRPDVYLKLADGARYALEYQRSAISPGEWRERHEAYDNLGIHDIWVLGENRLADALPTPEQQARWSTWEPHMHFLKLRAFEGEAAVRTPYEVAWWRGEQQEELWAPLEAAESELELGPGGFFTRTDQARLERHEHRVIRLESSRQGTLAVQESPTAYTAGPADGTADLFQPEKQEAEQRRRLQERAANPEWRRIVDRHGLSPENLHFLVGIPIPDDTVFLTHRTVWQAYIIYSLLMRRRGSLTAPGVAALLERKFGTHAEMVRTARYLLPGLVSGPNEVVGRFLNLLVDAGYLRNDQRSEFFRYYLPDSPPPPLAFADRRQRQAAWAGLLAGALRREGQLLVGEGGPIPLVPVSLADRPTPAQVAVVASLARCHGLEVDLEALTYTEAARILSEYRGK